MNPDKKIFKASPKLILYTKLYNAIDAKNSTTEQIIFHIENILPYYGSRDILLFESPANDRASLMEAICALPEGGDYILSFFIDKGAQVDYQNKEGKAALHVAIESGNISVVAYLLTRTPNLNLIDSNGNTPLHIVCSHAVKASVQMIQLILDKADPCQLNLPNKKQETPFYLFFEYALKEQDISISYSFKTLIKQMLTNGASPDIMTIQGQTVLFNACCVDVDDEIIDRVVQASTILNVTTDRTGMKGHTPLSWLFYNSVLNDEALKQTDDIYRKMELLLKHGANPNAKVPYFKKSKTFLQEVCSFEADCGFCATFVLLLLKYGAEPYISLDNRHMTLVDLVDNGTLLLNDSPDVVLLLKEAVKVHDLFKNQNSRLNIEHLEFQNFRKKIEYIEEKMNPDRSYFSSSSPTLFSPAKNIELKNLDCEDVNAMVIG